MTTPLITTEMAAAIASAVAAEIEKHARVEPTLNLTEAAEQLGLSVQVMRQLCREKKIPAIRLEKSYRIKIIDLNRYLDQHYTPAEVA